MDNRRKPGCRNRTVDVDTPPGWWGGTKGTGQEGREPGGNQGVRKTVGADTRSEWVETLTGTNKKKAREELEARKRGVSFCNDYRLEL